MTELSSSSSSFNTLLLNEEALRLQSLCSHLIDFQALLQPLGPGTSWLVSHSCVTAVTCHSGCVLGTVDALMLQEQGVPRAQGRHPAVCNPSHGESSTCV